MLASAVVLASLVTSSMPAAAPQGPGQPAVTVSGSIDFVALTERGDARVTFDAHAVAGMTRARQIVLQIATSPVESMTLDLEPFEVIAPNARVLRGGDRGDMPEMVFLRGDVRGEPQSRAFIALSERGSGMGLITRQGGERWHMGTRRGEAQPHVFITRLGADAPDLELPCAMLDDDGGIAGPGTGGGGGGGGGSAGPTAQGPRLLNVAVDSDQSYRGLFASDAAALEYMAMVVGAISDIYQRDLNMTLALAFARIWPDGGEPFAADNLSGFRTYWLQNEDMTGLNLVHMFSGVRSTSYGGIAYLSNACTQQAFAISAFLNGGFPADYLEPNLGNWDVNVVAHEIGHNLGTPHTHDYDPPVDTCAQGSDERGTIMSYCHTRPGGLLNIDMRMHAVTQDVIAEDNPPGAGSCLYHDCNGNLVNDALDIGDGTSADVNGDGIPDECQDCNSNGTLDPLEIAAGAADVNANGIPDFCETDCNANGVPDFTECAQGLASDANGNRIPDTCEPDCDRNGVADFLDIANGVHADLDRNSVPDVCDDCNGNGQPDWIDVDRAFNVFISTSADPSPSPIREYHAASGVLVSNYPGTTVQDSTDLAFGPDGALYVVSVFDFRVVRVDVDTGVASTFISQAAAGFTQMSSIVFGPDGSPYTVSPVNGQVRRYDASGAFIEVFADVDGTPYDLAFGPNGNLFILTSTQGVYEVDGTTGALIGQFVSPVNLSIPRGMCFLPNGDLLITNRGSDTVRRYSARGADLGVWNDDFPVENPWGITLGPRGHVFLAREASPVRIAEYTQGGRYIRSFIRGDEFLISPRSIVFRPASDQDGNANGIPDVCERTCQGDVAPVGGNAQVDIDDLLMVVSAWGPCPAAAYCAADIAPVGGNGLVNIDDLLAVISRWGPCP